MAKKKTTDTNRQTSGNNTHRKTPAAKPLPSHMIDLLALAGYIVIAVLLTFPLILRMNSSVYGFYDHITTDMFSNINTYFWQLRHLVFDLGSSPFETPMFSAPFGSNMNLTNLTGIIHLPITLIFGHLFSRNAAILFNLFMSGFGMFFLVRYLTKNAPAAFIAGIVYAFCPNMLVRSYTTFDSTQIQWIPFYTLFVLRFIEDRTWINALLAGLFLVLNIMFAMPYYLVFLPVHTVAILLAYASWRIWGEKRGGGFISDLTSPKALKGWLKIGTALAAVVIVFLIYYTTVIGVEYASSVQRTTAQLEELALKPSDYLMPHPRSALLKGDIKESYWNTARPGKDPDSFVAYIGYIALALAAYGLFKGKGSPARWVFFAAALVAFWATLGPTLLGLPTPSGLIHSIYASFARRILIYKAFVQFGIAGLAGIGAARLFELPALAAPNARKAVLAVLAFLMVAEYSLVPPALSVDLSETPEVYQKVRELSDDTVLFEVPFKRNSGKIYQGYAYYQTFHEKPLFNASYGLAKVPGHIRPFYTQMEVPLEAQEYANLAALRYLGVTHLTYHWYIGTKTVIFGSLAAPQFFSVEDNRIAFGEIDGLKRVYTNADDPFSTEFQGPYDYTFANLYEITAEPCPVALTFDYHNPYEDEPGLLSRDGMTEYGWRSALVDTSATFYFPLTQNKKLTRLLRQGGEITARNLSDKPLTFEITFTAADGGNGGIIETKWNDGPVKIRFDSSAEGSACRVADLSLAPHETGVLSVWSTTEAFPVPVDIQGSTINIPASAVLTDFRVNVR